MGVAQACRRAMVMDGGLLVNNGDSTGDRWVLLCHASKPFMHGCWSTLETALVIGGCCTAMQTSPLPPLANQCLDNYFLALRI